MYGTNHNSTGTEQITDLVPTGGFAIGAINLDISDSELGMPWVPLFISHLQAFIISLSVLIHR